MQEFYFDENLFDLWNNEKKLLNRKIRIVNPKPREIRYIKIGVNVWNEIFWKIWFFRPVLVISKIGNMLFCVPMTTKWKHPEYYIRILSVWQFKKSYIVINQWRTFDAQRFFTKIAKISVEESKQIKKLLCYRYFPEVL